MFTLKRSIISLAFLCSTAVLLTGCSITLPWQRKSGLQVLTNDVPASVVIDGKKSYDIPYLNKELPPGEYSLNIIPNDSSLQTYQTKVSLKAGLLTVVSWKPGKRPETSGGVIYEMEPLRNSSKSELSLSTIPDGAIVHLDGQAQGFAPILLDTISKGEHEYEVKLPSYETQKHTINVLEGYRMIVTLKLAKQEVVNQPSPTTVSDLTASKSAGVATPSGVLASPSSSPKPSASVKPTASPKISTASATPKSTSINQTEVLARPKVKIKSTNYLQDGKEGLRVRSTPGAGGTEVGFAPTGSEYAYLGKTQAGWYQISFGQTEGWVSGQFAELLQ